MFMLYFCCFCVVLNLICSISVIFQSANLVEEPSSPGQPDKFPGLYCLFDLWHWPFLYGRAGPPGNRIICDCLFYTDMQVRRINRIGFECLFYTDLQVRRINRIICDCLFYTDMQVRRINRIGFDGLFYTDLQVRRINRIGFGCLFYTDM